MRDPIKYISIQIDHALAQRVLKEVAGGSMVIPNMHKAIRAALAEWLIIRSKQ